MRRDQDSCPRPALATPAVQRPASPGKGLKSHGGHSAPAAGLPGAPEGQVCDSLPGEATPPEEPWAPAPHSTQAAVRDERKLKPRLFCLTLFLMKPEKLDNQRQ